MAGRRGEDYRRVKQGGLMAVYESNMSAGTPGETPRALLGNEVESMMLLDFTTYMRDDILVKVDRASMAVSLEAREPLLDHRLIEFAWSLPLAMRRRKNILRTLLRRFVPQSMIDREKRGFGLPIPDAWLAEWSNDILASASGTFAVTPETRWRVLMYEAWLREQ
jgi:asparagine synthetase B (glutamine-hydrolysing)